MKSIPKSGFYYPDRFAFLILKSIQEITGKGKYDTIIRNAGLPELLKKKTPGNFERQFDFADISSLNHALEKVYGNRGGRATAARIGKAYFRNSLPLFGLDAISAKEVFLLVPKNKKLETLLKQICRIFTETTDQRTTLTVDEQNFYVMLEKTPFCWGRSGYQSPACSMFTGFLQQAAEWADRESEYIVNEKRCQGINDTHCLFEIQKQPET